MTREPMPDFLGLKGLVLGGLVALGICTGLLSLSNADLEGWRYVLCTALGCALVYALCIVGHEVEWDRWERKHRSHRKESA